MYTRISDIEVPDLADGETLDTVGVQVRRFSLVLGQMDTSNRLNDTPIVASVLVRQRPSRGRAVRLVNFRNLYM
eukprot:SAG11_NODE_7749_length_1101_cov_1.328343_1_plen_74_part_00